MARRFQVARLSAVAGILCVLIPAELRGLDPRLRISQYHKQYWQVEQGLPHTYVTAIRQTPDGFLAVGTDEGLARFDGLSFRQIRADASLRLSQRWISAMVAAADGSLWVGTFEGLLIQLRGERALSSHQVGGSVFALVEDTQGVVWASTRNGVFRIEKGNRSKVPALAPPSETSWNVLALDTRGVLWVVCTDGLFRQGAGTFTRRLDNGGRYGEILSVHAGRGGLLWLGTTKGLFRFRDGEGTSPSVVAGVPGPVVSLLEDIDGNAWAGTWGRGLYQVAGDRVESWNAENGLPDDFIRTLGSDDEGNLWIGMRSGGLGRWRETRLVPVGTAEGTAGNYATTVAADPNGNLWLGTWRGGLYRLNEGRLESQPIPLPTLYFTVRALAFDREGRQWIGNWEGLFGFDGRRYQRYATEADSPYGRVSALLFDRNGGLWIGTAGRGLFRFSSGRPEGPVSEPLLPEAEVTALIQGSDGAIWVGTTKGLGRLPDENARQVSPMQGAPAEAVESLFEDSKGRVWASTAAGVLLVVTGSGVTALDRKNGLPEHPLYRVLQDRVGGFWVSSPRGLLELRADSVEAVLSGNRKQLDVLIHGQDDGMRTIECHGLSQPAGGRDRDGSLWFPTAKGFVRVRPQGERQFPAPRVVVEEIATDSGLVARSGQIDLRPGARNLEIRFTAIRLTSPRKVQFRYRMAGFDPDWVEAGNQRSARYNELPPGGHLFEVEARDPGGAWGGLERLSFRQEPRFHQTWWIYALSALAALAAVGGVYRWRLHAVRGRYSAVLEERNRIGREWHDTLVAGFSAISLQLEAALARMKDHPERASEILDVTRKMVHHYRAEARRVIWDLRDNRPEGETLPMAVENALARVTENRGIEGRVSVEGEPVALPVELQHNVLRICQEAMSNAARHGSPSRIDIDLSYTEALLRAVVRDDGGGFDPERTATESAGHFGLTVMQERARRHGGHLRIESAIGKGTAVEAAVPLGKGRG